MSDDTGDTKKPRGAAKSQANGALFERIFMRACQRDGMAVTQMPSGCKWVGRRIIPVKTAFDWILSYNAKTALIDTKTINSSAFPNSFIEVHQLEALIAHELKGTKAGYVVWLRRADQIIFIPASLLNRMINSRGSIGSLHEEVVQLGGAFNFDPKLIFSN